MIAQMDALRPEMSEASPAQTPPRIPPRSKSVDMKAALVGDTEMPSVESDLW